MTETDLIWILILGLLILAAVSESVRRFGDWFTPLTIFVGVNAGSLALYHFRLLALNPVSFPTHAIVLASFLFFLGGSRLAVGHRALVELRVRRTAPDSAGLDWFFKLTVVLSAIGWISASLILVAKFGLGTLLANIWVLQNQFQMQFIGYLNMLGILVPPLYAIRRATGRQGPLDHLFLASAVLGLLLAGIKSYLVVTSLASLLAWSVSRPGSFRFRHLAATLFLLLAFFVAYTTKVDIFVADAFEGVGNTTRFSVLQRPYLYLVGSWPAMESIVQGVIGDAPRVGFVTLQPLWKVLGEGLGLIESVPTVLPFSHVGAAEFNVYSFVGEVTWDWGWPGALAASWLLGFLSTRLYATARRTASWRHALVYAIIGYGVALSSFMYVYRFNLMVMLAYVYIIGFVVLRGGILIDRRSCD